MRCLKSSPSTQAVWKSCLGVPFSLGQNSISVSLQNIDVADEDNSTAVHRKLFVSSIPVIYLVDGVQAASVLNTVRGQAAYGRAPLSNVDESPETIWLGRLSALYLTYHSRVDIISLQVWKLLRVLGMSACIHICTTCSSM